MRCMNVTCLNPTCENHQKNLKGTKFCPECGQKTANPEPQNHTCPAADCTNQGKDLGRMKFCSECGSTTVAIGGADPKTTPSSPKGLSADGMVLPQAQLPSGYAAYQAGAAGSGGSRSIVGGDQIITTTVVQNQDQTKQVRQCAVSGRQAEVTSGHVCPSCDLWVHADYFDRDLMQCDRCRTGNAQRASEQFGAKVREFLSDGVITKEELSELRSLGARMGLSLPEQDTIIEQLKRESMQSASTQRSMSLIDQTRWKAVLRAMENKAFSSNPAHLDSLRTLQKSYPDDELIATLLICALLKKLADAPTQFVAEIEQVLAATCFAHDSPQKYLTQALFYRIGSLMGHAMVPRSDEEGSWADMLEQFSEKLSEAAASLERMFPDSDECHALQVAMMIDSYHLSGDNSIREDVNLLLEGGAAAAGKSDIGLALKAAYENATNGQAWGEERELPAGQGLARMYFEKLFSNFVGSNNLNEICTALEYVIQHKGSCCGTLEIKDSKAWVQVMAHVVNCYYPHKENPMKLYPDLFNQSIISKLTDFEKEIFMTIELNEWRLEEMVSWLKSYITRVLNLDLKTINISHHNEDLS